MNKKDDTELIEHYIDKYDCTTEEAKSIILWDSSDTETEETKQAKENWKQVSRVGHDARTNATNKKTEKVKVENESKKTVIRAVSIALEQICATDIVIRNDEKYIDFVLDGKKMEINLVQKRVAKPKKV